MVTPFQTLFIAPFVRSALPHLFSECSRVSWGIFLSGLPCILRTLAQRVDMFINCCTSSCIYVHSFTYATRVDLLLLRLFSLERC